MSNFDKDLIEKEIYLRGTKIIHMSIIGITTFFLGAFVSKRLDSFATKKEERKKKSTFYLLSEICVYIAFIYIGHYIIRNILKLLNNVFISDLLYWKDDIGYDISKLASINGGVAMAFAILSFSDRLKSNVRYYIE